MSNYRRVQCWMFDWVHDIGIKVDWNKQKHTQAEVKAILQLEKMFL